MTTPEPTEVEAARENLLNSLVGEYYHELKLDGTYDAIINDFEAVIRRDERERMAAPADASSDNH